MSADIGQETSNLSKYSILQQTGIAALAAVEQHAAERVEVAPINLRGVGLTRSHPRFFFGRAIGKKEHSGTHGTVNSSFNLSDILSAFGSSSQGINVQAAVAASHCSRIGPIERVGAGTSRAPKSDRRHQCYRGRTSPPCKMR